MDVKSTFLNGVLKEEVYVEQSLGYIKSIKRTQDSHTEEGDVQIKESLESVEHKD
jgi:hypothetical protein